jgi:hypothetical protein
MSWRAGLADIADDIISALSEVKKDEFDVASYTKRLSSQFLEAPKSAGK